MSNSKVSPAQLLSRRGRDQSRVLLTNTLRIQMSLLMSVSRKRFSSLYNESLDVFVDVGVISLITSIHAGWVNTTIPNVPINRAIFIIGIIFEI